MLDISVYDQIVANLRDVADKHRNNFVFTGDVNAAAMADDAANSIEELLNYIKEREGA